MTILAIGLGVAILLIVLTNTKRWKRLARGARRAKNELETQVKQDEKRP